MISKKQRLILVITILIAFAVVIWAVAGFLLRGRLAEEVPLVPISGQELTKATETLKIQVLEKFQEEIFHRAYYYPNEIAKGVRLETLNPEERIEAPEAGVFFWLDLSPARRFAHPTRFVLIGESGQVYQYDRNWWPIIAGQPWWSLQAEREGDQYLVSQSDPGEISSPAESEPEARLEKILNDIFPKASAAGKSVFQIPSSGPCPGNRVPRHFAVVVNAFDDPNMGFNKDANNTYQMLLNSNYTAENVFYLGPDLSQQGVDAPVSKENLEKTLADLAKKIECCDTLFVYISSHGETAPTEAAKQYTYYYQDAKGQTQTSQRPLHRAKDFPAKGLKFLGAETADSYIVFKPNQKNVELRGDEKYFGQRMRASKIAELLKNIKSCNKTFLLDACHSGGFIKHLKDVPGLTTLTSADADREAVDLGKDEGGVFTKNFLAAFGDASGQADINKDGTVSMEEGQKYASQKIKEEFDKRVATRRKQLKERGKSEAEIVQILGGELTYSFGSFESKFLYQNPRFVQGSSCACPAVTTQPEGQSTKAGEVSAPTEATPTATPTPAAAPSPIAAPPAPGPAPQPAKQPANLSESTNRISNYHAERSTFPDKSLNALITIRDQLNVDIKFLENYELDLRRGLDDLLATKRDIEFNISETEKALQGAEPEDRPKLEQILADLNRSLNTINDEIAVAQGEIKKNDTTVSLGKVTLSACQSAISQKQ